jgi:activator of 2-hydroxyglutaryl-CoA dehydratase
MARELPICQRIAIMFKWLKNIFKKKEPKEVDTTINTKNYQIGIDYGKGESKTVLIKNNRCYFI